MRQLSAKIVCFEVAPKDYIAARVGLRYNPLGQLRQVRRLNLPPAAAEGTTGSIKNCFLYLLVI